jgi:hypothetical protein
MFQAVGLRGPRASGRLTAVALALAIGLASACGGGDDEQTADKEQIRSVSTEANSILLAGLEGRAGRRDYDVLCSLMTKKAKAQVARYAKTRLHKRGGCPDWWRGFFLVSEASSGAVKARVKALIRRMRNFKIRSIRIEGDTALVTDNTSFIDGEGGPTRLRKEDGRWLLAEAR